MWYLERVRVAKSVPRAQLMIRAGKRWHGFPAGHQIGAMLSAVQSAAVHGIESYDVTVEVDSSHGLPNFTIVGLPVGAVKESRQRVSAALVNSGFVLPPRRITVNLAPADVPKNGTAFDLPIALGVLAATGQLSGGWEALSRAVFMGELGLDGSLRPVRGVLAVARRLARDRLLVVPPANASEAALARSVSVSSPASLRQLVTELARKGLSDSPASVPVATPIPDVDFNEVAGQCAAKRALEIAAAGGHGVLLVGPPGAGKTMLARRLPTILPPLGEDEALEVMAIHSVAGLLTNGVAALPLRPFRAPHHSVSAAGLVGGGSAPRPGEVSLAHHGVLFLDEMLEFPRHVLDALRQPMEDGRITLSRASGSVTYPSRFSLVGAMNPCLCGLSGTPRSNECSCSEADIRNYRARLSGPLRDRIDLVVNVNALPISDLASPLVSRGDSSTEIRERVERARSRQVNRFIGMRGTTSNAQASGAWMQRNVPLANAARELLLEAVERLHLSARAYHRVMKMSLTIADLAESNSVTAEAVGEALRYR